MTWLTRNHPALSSYPFMRSPLILASLFLSMVCRFDSVPNKTKSRPDAVELVLREWFDLPPSLEFRCFVCQKVLVAISQRDSGNFYPFLRENKEVIRRLIVEFYYNKISQRFLSVDCKLLAQVLVLSPLDLKASSPTLGG